MGELSYSSQVTSHLPIQNGAIRTACRGPSSSPRLSSFIGLPSVNVPPGIGSISNVTAVPGMVSTYGFISRAGSSGCRGGGPRRRARPRRQHPESG